MNVAIALEQPIIVKWLMIISVFFSKIKEQRYSPTELDNSLREILMEVGKGF